MLTGSVYFFLFYSILFILKHTLSKKRIIKKIKKHNYEMSVNKFEKSVHRSTLFLLYLLHLGKIRLVVWTLSLRVKRVCSIVCMCIIIM